MIRYLEVEVTRTQTSTVFLRVDDEAPGFRDGFNGDDVTRKIGTALWPVLDDAVSDTLRESDWDDGGDVDYSSAKIVPEAEARKYEVYDCAPHIPQGMITTPTKQARRELMEFIGAAV